MSTRLWPALDIRFQVPSPDEQPQLEARLSAALDDFPLSAIQELDDRWLVFFSSSDARDRAAEALSAESRDRFTAEPIDVADEDWARRSQQDLGAVEVGRVVIAPPWAEAARNAPAPGRVIVVIQPSMGFGTGHHATTRLCTALLQRLDLSGRSVLDVGTGSGVLALAALALGAGSVLAVDDDADAIESARENLALNGGPLRLELRVADFRALPANTFDVVVANLTGGLLASSAEELAGVVAPGGRLVVSGVTLEEEAAVLRAFAPWMDVVERLTEDEWTAALLRHRARTRGGCPPSPSRASAGPPQPGRGGKPRATPPVRTIAGPPVRKIPSSQDRPSTLLGTTLSEHPLRLRVEGSHDAAPG